MNISYRMCNFPCVHSIICHQISLILSLAESYIWKNVKYCLVLKLPTRYILPINTPSPHSHPNSTTPTNPAVMYRTPSYPSLNTPVEWTVNVRVLCGWGGLDAMVASPSFNPTPSHSTPDIGRRVGVTMDRHKDESDPAMLCQGKTT